MKKLLIRFASVCAAAGLVLLLSGCLAGNLFAALCVNPNLAEREFNWGWPDPSCAVLRAWDLGETVYDGRAVLHYRVDGMLRSGRSVDLYLDIDPDSHGHRGGSLVERHLVLADEKGVPCVFFMDVPKGDFPLRVPLDKLAPNLTGTDAMNRNMCGYRWENGTFCVYAAKGTRQWTCRTRFDWTHRNPWLVPIRPLYGVPAAVCMLPADVLMMLESLFEIPLHGLWTECYTYGRWSSAVGEIGSDDAPGVPDPNGVILYAPFRGWDQPRAWLSPH